MLANAGCVTRDIRFSSADTTAVGVGKLYAVTAPEGGLFTKLVLL